MLEIYSNEIIALIAIIIVIYIYIKIKKSKKQKQELQKIKDEFQNTQKSEQNIQDIDDKVQEIIDDPYEDKIVQKPTYEDIEPKGLKEIVPEDIKPKEQISTQKRKVPKHNKIVKNDFKKFSGAKLLIAEDSFINQKVLLGLLDDSGIEISIANNGQEALNILQKDHNFDFILMDIHMPIMDGFEATWKIRNEPIYDKIPIIALSGDTATDDIRKMHNAGMKEVLEKPLKLEALYDVFYTYTKDKEEQKAKEVLEYEKGLDVCGYDEEFYSEILKDFIRDYSNSFEILNEFIKNYKLSDADKILLDILGITANIGATELNSIAQKLKESIKEQNSNDISTLLASYKNALETLLKEIETKL